MASAVALPATEPSFAEEVLAGTADSARRDETAPRVSDPTSPFVVRARVALRLDNAE